MVGMIEYLPMGFAFGLVISWLILFECPSDHLVDGFGLIDECDVSTLGKWDILVEFDIRVEGNIHVI